MEALEDAGLHGDAGGRLIGGEGGADDVDEAVLDCRLHLGGQALHLAAYAGDADDFLADGDQEAPQCGGAVQAGADDDLAGD